MFQTIYLLILYAFSFSLYAFVLRVLVTCALEKLRMRVKEISFWEVLIGNAILIYKVLNNRVNASLALHKSLEKAQTPSR